MAAVAPPTCNVPTPLHRNTSVSSTCASSAFLASPLICRPPVPRGRVSPPLDGPDPAVDLPVVCTASLPTRALTFSACNSVLPDLNSSPVFQTDTSTSNFGPPNFHSGFSSGQSDPLALPSFLPAENSSSRLSLLLVPSSQLPCRSPPSSGAARGPCTAAHKPLLSSSPGSELSLAAAVPSVTPLYTQRSSPTLLRVATSPPRSPVHYSKGCGRKLSCPKASRVSPSQFKHHYQYSIVPKSDSAYSEEPYSYSPISRGYSPASEFPYSHSNIPVWDTQALGQYTRSIPKSDSAYSEQYTTSPFWQTLLFPKSRSTIFRSDSAYSDIEYTYTTLPGSDSHYLHKGCAYSSLRKSESAYSENILCHPVSKQRSVIPKSFSSYSDRLRTYSQTEIPENISLPRDDSPVHFPAEPSIHQVSPKLSECSLLRTPSSPSHSKGSTLIPVGHSFPSYGRPLSVKSHSSYACVSSPDTDIMPTLKSFLKAPSKKPASIRPNKNDQWQDTPVVPGDVSPHCCSLDKPSSSEPQIRKSHTVLALSSTISSSSSASTRLLPITDRSRCNASSCLTKSLKHSISQTLSIAQNLNSYIGPESSSTLQRKRSRRRSNLSAFLPLTFSRSSSIAPSLASAGGSCLTSYSGACGGGEDTLYCRLCLTDVSVNLICQLTVCQCRFCQHCLSQYTRLVISEGRHVIACPDAACDGAGELTVEEVEAFAGRDMRVLRDKLKLNAEVVADPYRVWCPNPGCETVVHLTRSKFSLALLDSPPQTTEGPTTIVSVPVLTSAPISAHVYETPISHIATMSPKPASPISTIDGFSVTPDFVAAASSPPLKNKRVRRAGTTVNVFAAGREHHVKAEREALILELCLDAPHQDRGSNNTKFSTEICNELDNISRSNELTAPSSPLGVVDVTCSKLKGGETTRTVFQENNSCSTERETSEKRKISLEEVNMIRTIGKPKTLALSSEGAQSVRSACPSVVSEYPADLALSAAMAALQSPAEYRSFAGILSPAPQQDGAICPTCRTVFCPACGGQCHSGRSCSALVGHGERTGIRRQCKLLLGVGEEQDWQGVIKSCPNPKCQVSIERNEGCAQMQCRVCRHTFCWYCLASLEEDFLLRHYDKGPCRNKLGHSRASVLCHRLQVLAIFLGVGLLVLAASPLLLVFAPCVICSRCLADRDHDDDHELE